MKNTHKKHILMAIGIGILSSISLVSQAGHRHYSGCGHSYYSSGYGHGYGYYPRRHGYVGHYNPGHHRHHSGYRHSYYGRHGQQAYRHYNRHHVEALPHISARIHLPGLHLRLD